MSEMQNYNDHPPVEEMFAEVEQEQSQQQAAPEQKQEVEQNAPQTDNGQQAAEPEYLDLSKYGQQLVRYKANGKEVVEPLEVAIQKRASMGYNYAQNQEQLNREREEWQKKLEGAKELEKWKQFDEFARQNPQWAEHVQSAWEQRHQFQEGRDPEDPYDQKLSSFEKMLNDRLSQFEQRLSPFEQEIEQRRIEQEDTEFDTSINEVKQKFERVDFDQVDDQGKSLEYRILEHMTQNGFPSFESAFKDFYFDNLIDLERSSIKEQHAKEAQKRAKQGIIGYSTTPSQQNPAQGPSNGNIRDLSYEQLAEMAKRDPIWQSG